MASDQPDNSQILDDKNPDKAEEYFKTKEEAKTFRADLRELKEEHENTKEIDELAEKLKKLRSEVNNDENIRILSDKISTLRERMGLLRDIIKMQLIEAEEKEVKRDGRILKIVQVLKEMKEEK